MNPNDVLPPRNLPDLSAPWGREVEKRVLELEKVSIGNGEHLNNGNRTTAAVTSELARQLKSLEEILEGLEDLYNAIPKTHQDSNRTTGFSASNQWVSVNTITVEMPEGSTHAEISAFGSGSLTYDTGVATIRGRMVIRGAAGPRVTADEFYTAGGWWANLTPQHTRSLDGWVPSFEVRFEILAEDASAFPAHPDNYANVTVLATFTG